MHLLHNNTIRCIDAMTFYRACISKNKASVAGNGKVQTLRQECQSMNKRGNELKSALCESEATLLDTPPRYSVSIQLELFVSTGAVMQRRKLRETCLRCLRLLRYLA